MRGLDDTDVSRSARVEQCVHGRLPGGRGIASPEAERDSVSRCSPLPGVGVSTIRPAVELPRSGHLLPESATRRPTGSELPLTVLQPGSARRWSRSNSSTASAMTTRGPFVALVTPQGREGFRLEPLCCSASCQPNEVDASSSDQRREASCADILVVRPGAAGAGQRVVSEPAGPVLPGRAPVAAGPRHPPAASPDPRPQRCTPPRRRRR